jgi:hypothetical protein
MGRNALLAAVIILTALLGCISSTNPEETTTTESTIETTTTTSLETTTTVNICGPKSIPYKDGCCSDRNGNGLCDSGETRASWAQATVATTKRTTTTKPKVGCSDGVWNQNEVDVDCGGICKNECDFFSLQRDGETAYFRSYGFKLRDSMLNANSLEYTLWINTPGGLRDERTVAAGYEGGIDTLKFRVINGTEVNVFMRAALDKQLVARAPSNAVVNTIGGQQCLQKGGGLCTRTYRGYNITMQSRIDGGVRLKVIRPDGVGSTGTAWQNGTTYSTLNKPGITIGVLNYFIPGGYSNIYVMPKQTYASTTKKTASSTTTTQAASSSTTVQTASSSTTTQADTSSTSSQTTLV